MGKNIFTDAVTVQDASNIVAVTELLREMMVKARDCGVEPRNSPATIAVFFKVYDMMGAPSETKMYEALKKCESMSEVFKNT